jgi:hypothetical protein
LRAERDLRSQQLRLTSASSMFGTPNFRSFENVSPTGC